MSNEVLIKVENLSKSYGTNEVLSNVNMQIEKGEVIAIIGPSGCGKSTFIRTLNQLENVTGGSIYLDGEEITKKGVDINDVRRRVGMVFQHFSRRLPRHSSPGGARPVYTPRRGAVHRRTAR